MSATIGPKEGDRYYGFFKYKRQLLGDFCRCAFRSLTYYFEVVNGNALTLGVIAVIQTFADRSISALTIAS
jgi:hypothetical protein